VKPSSTIIREQLRTWLLAGGSPKRFAYETGLTPGRAYQIAWDIGFRTAYLSDEERKLIQSKRSKVL
jgi:hypothetical protein